MIGLFALALAATSAAEPKVLVDGYYIWAACTSPKSSKLYDQLRAYCRAYVAGVADMEGVLSGYKGVAPLFCVPKSGTTEELAATVSRYSELHSEKYPGAAVNIVIMALHEAYPCR